MNDPASTSKRLIRFTRVIQIVGEPEWVAEVLMQSLVPRENDHYETPQGHITCLSGKQEEVRWPE